MNIAMLIDELFAQGVELWPNGEQLGCRGPKEVLTPDRLALINQHKSAILAQLTHGATTHPLNIGQQGLWFEQQYAPNHAAYNVSFAARIQSPVAPAALQRACQLLVNRHPALRTTFGVADGKPYQRIHRFQAVAFTVIKAGAWTEEQVQAEVTALQEAPFDLEAGPLLRVTLLTRHATDHLLVLSLHHLIVDGWSLWLLLDELKTLYPAALGGYAPALPPLPTNYTDYIAWQQELLISDGERLWNYWRTQLAGELPILNLPTDHPHPPARSYQGASLPVKLPAELTAQLRALARQEGVTLYMLLLAAFQVLLHRYTGQEDLLVGSPMAGRNRPEFADIVGYFASPIVMRATVTANASFRTLLQQVRQTVLDALEHQAYPFPLLVEQLQPVRNQCHTPVFQSAFALQRPQRGGALLDHLGSETQTPGVEWGGLTLQPLQLRMLEGVFDLFLELFDHPTALVGALKYNRDLFEQATMERLIGHFQTLLAGIVTHPDQRVAALPLLTPAERRQLLVEWNPPAPTMTAPAVTLHQWFEAQVARTPDAIAVIATADARQDHQENTSWGANRITLTYGELNARANQLAHFLRKQGVGQGPAQNSLVGLCVERTVEMVVGILGILKAGGAYIPLDPTYPPERLAFQITDTQTALVVTQQHLLERLTAPNATLLCLDRDWAQVAQESTADLGEANSGDDLAYVIYTSGSTGTPKGVAITHANVVRLFTATEQWFHFGDRDVWTLFHSYAFDFSVWELWGALLYGGRLVVVPYWLTRAPDAFYRLLADEGVTVLNQTPSAFQQLIWAEQQADAAAALPALRLVIFGGEALEPASLQPWFVRYGAVSPQLVNMYGITETTVHVTYRPLTAADACAGQSSPIGRPLPDLQLYLLDNEHNPVPIGVPGELYVSGAGVARGYLNRPALTAERFIDFGFDEVSNNHNPKSQIQNPKLYKTGDLARYRPNGELEFLGRIDNQVKVRGFRIELGEIEAFLHQQPAVQQAVVVVREDQPGDKRLVAYVVAQPGDGGDAVVGALRQAVQKSLPDYMTPAAFVLVDALPLTANGKVNRRALPAPVDVYRGAADTFVAPRTPLEVQIAEIWATVLGVAQVSMADDFFERGGHSLLATQVIAKISAVCGVDLPLRSLFTARTVAGVAQAVFQIRQAGQQRDLAWAPLVPDPAHEHEPFPLTDVQLAYWVGRNDLFAFGNVSAHFYLEFDSTGLDLERLNWAWQQIVERHGMLRAIMHNDGQQQILADVPPYRFTLYDFAAAPFTVDAHHALTNGNGRVNGTSNGATNSIFNGAAKGASLPALAPTAEAHLAAIRQEMSHQVLPADTWPLFDIRVTRLQPQQVRLHISLDALVLDGWSLFILFNEWMALYRDPSAVLPPLALSFRDYVLAEKEFEASERYQRSWAYWCERLATLPLAPDLPMIQNPQTLAQPQFQRHTFTLAADHWQQLKARGNRAGLTPSGILLTAFSEVLARWSKSPRFTLNLTLFHRLPLHPQVNAIVGDFTPLMLLAIDNSTAAPFVTRAQQVQQQLWTDLDHRYVSGVRVMRELARQQGSGIGNAQMPVVFSSVLALDQDTADFDLFGKLIYSISQTPQMWLDHQVMEKAGALVFNWDVVEELFPPGLIDDMFTAYCTLLQRLATDEALWQATHLPLLPAAQAAQRHAVNATTAPLSNDLLHTLFLQQVTVRAQEPAVIAPDTTLTYAELYRRANAIGHWLRQQSVTAGGSLVNRLVAVVMEKGWEQVAAVLGIHLAGAAYLPIDPHLPTERQHYLLSQGEVTLALTQSRLTETLLWPGGITRLAVDQAPVADLPPLSPVQAPSDLAYVIYTSGSTGLPKGVVIDHRGAVNTILDVNRRFGITAGDRVLALSALNFDLSVYDIFGLLAVGGAIVMPSPDRLTDPGHWLALMQRHQVTLWDTVPALMQMLVDYVEPEGGRQGGTRLGDTRLGEGDVGEDGGLRVVMMSGDWIPVTLPARIQRLWEGVQVYSLGGATEASIWSIYYPIGAVDPAWRSIPYGRPLTNQSFHVLDDHLQPRPVWAPGQLYIGGSGLALGYWRDEAKTNASFISRLTPDGQVERLYKTGDLGRYLPAPAGGLPNIEFLGREDFQVKIRGHRIELGEIESNLLQHPLVKEAVVNAVGDPKGLKQLVAYVVLEEQPDALPADQAGAPAGALANGLERMEFKLSQSAIRTFSAMEATECVTLPAPPLDEAVRNAFLWRQSYRHFTPEPVALATVSALLGCLRQLQVAAAPLPKYRYPSVNSLYPVQTYLYVKPGQVIGLAGGFYYYQPARHELVRLPGASADQPTLYSGSNQRIFAEAAFSLFLVGEMNAIAPLYGAFARDFCLLETGYMSQLLMTEAPQHELGLCPIGDLNYEAAQRALGLTESQHLLHNLVGGPIAPVQRTQWLQGPGKSNRLSWQEQLRTHLAAKLPEYILPTTYVALDALPLTANGKVNRQALPAPESLHEPSATYAPPQTAVEQHIAAIIRETVGLEQVGRHDNFFDLGVDSVQLVQVYTKLRAAFPGDLTVTEVFRYPTISALAGRLSQQSSEPVAVEAGYSRGAARRASRQQRHSPHERDPELATAVE